MNQPVISLNSNAMYLSSDTESRVNTRPHCTTAETAQATDAGPNRHIGDLIREAHSLSADQVETVLRHQREHGPFHPARDDQRLPQSRRHCGAAPWPTEPCRWA